jgi:hypothetical protein
VGEHPDAFLFLGFYLDLCPSGSICCERRHGFSDASVIPILVEDLMNCCLVFEIWTIMVVGEGEGFDERGVACFSL